MAIWGDVTLKALIFAGAVVGVTLASPALAQSSLPASAIPDLVVPPNGINLGSTSFYDGFSTLKPGVTLLEYVRQNNLTSITDSQGGKSPAFDHPRINTTTLLSQISVASPVNINGNVLGFDVLVPITNINSSFGPRGMQLTDNGLNIGDITFGPFIQFKPVMGSKGPVASIRLALDVMAPTGGFDRNRDLNQSSGFWSINPYVAWTILPAKGWEFSGRTQYLYSVQTSKIANAPTIPGFTFRDGQAGQLFYSSFTASREVSRGIAVGLNGFGVQQLTNDRINDISLPDTKRSALYIGPGLHIDRQPKWLLNANVYLPIMTKNYATGPQFNLQLILPLR